MPIELAIALLATATASGLLWQWWSFGTSRALYSAMAVFVVAVLFGSRHAARMTNRRVVRPLLHKLSRLVARSRQDTEDEV